MISTKKIVLSVLVVLMLLSYDAKGQEVNTFENMNGFLIDFGYSIAPISSMSPKPSPHSLLGAGISFVSNEAFQFGVRGDITLPTAKYTEGYTLYSDTINVAYSFWDLKAFAAYLINLDAISSNISPVISIGYGKADVNRIHFYEDDKKELLEYANLVIVEPGVNYNFIADESFILSVGVSYQITIPDQLMVNYSSRDMNMLKFNVGLSFGLMRDNRGGWGRRR